MEGFNWNEHIKRLLKSELVRRGISHEELATRLRAIGLEETKSSVDSKISRGTFSAAFLLQCLAVIGCKSLVPDIDHLILSEPHKPYETTKKQVDDAI
jgi:hypothetical protein